MKELTIRELVAKLKVTQLWTLITTLLVSLSTVFIVGYNLGSFYQETAVCYFELKEKDNVITSLEVEKMDLKEKILELTGEIGQCKVVVLSLKEVNENMEPVLKMFLEELYYKEE